MVFWRLERAVEELCFPLSELCLSLGLSFRPEINSPIPPSFVYSLLPSFIFVLVYSTLLLSAVLSIMEGSIEISSPSWTSWSLLHLTTLTSSKTQSNFYLLTHSVTICRVEVRLSWQLREEECWKAKVFCMEGALCYHRCSFNQKVERVSVGFCGGCSRVDCRIQGG